MPVPVFFLLLSFGAGGAALASMTLIRHVSAWILLVGAFSGVLCGGLSLYFRRFLLPLLGASTAMSIVATWLFFLGMTYKDGSYKVVVAIGEEGSRETWTFVLIASTVLAGIFSAVLAPGARGARKILVHRPTEAPDRVLIIASVWLFLVTGGAIGMRALCESAYRIRLGHGGFTWAAQGLAMVLGATAAGVVVFRNAHQKHLLPARRRVLLGLFLLVTQGGAGISLLVALIAHSRPLTGIVELSLGEGFACALHRDGRVLCWGKNDEGQLGDGTRDHQYFPVKVLGLGDAIHITGSPVSTCALRRSGRVVCWGGEYDDGDNRGPFRLPEEVPALPKLRWMTGSAWRACGLTENDTVLCWTEKGASGPEHPVSVPPGSVDLLACPWGACFRTRDHGVQCWQDSAEAAREGKNMPACFNHSPPNQNADAVPGTLEWSHGLCEMTTSGRKRCWGFIDQTTETCVENYEVWGVEDAASIVRGVNDEACVLDRGGRVRSVRSERDANGEFILRWGATLLDGVVGLWSNNSINYQALTCAVGSGGTVYCWGSPNKDGEVGNGTQQATLTPTLVRR